MAPLATARLLADALSVVPGVSRVELAGHPQDPTGLRVICQDTSDPNLVAVGVRRVLSTHPQLGSNANDMGIDIVEEVPVQRRLTLVRDNDRPSSEYVAEASTRFRHPSQGSFVARLVELARAGRARDLELLRLEVVRGRTMSVAVVLGAGGIPVTGHADVGLEGIDVALAAATLRAVVSALHEDLYAVPLAVTTAHLGPPTVGMSVVVVGIEMTAPDEEAERLVGVSEVEGDVRAAVVRATLDAVNRRLAQPDVQAASADRTTE